MRGGNLFVISGPSGVGKGTLVARLVDHIPNAWLSVSATSRPPRNDETDGKDYHFLSADEFMHMAQNGGFLEWARYGDNCYGTPREPVEEHLAQGGQVFLEIDVQGAFQLREKHPEIHLIFIEPPSLEELERRLRGRGTESEDVIQKRLDAAAFELSHSGEYDIVLVNDVIEETVDRLVDFVNAQAKE